MRIGELSRRTGVATRLLRYYEQQGLLASTREENGYRAFDEADVERVERVHGLIQSGLTTRLIGMLLRLEGTDGQSLAASCTQMVAEVFLDELRDIEARIACLSRSRDSLRGWLDTTPYGGSQAPVAS